VHPTRVLYLIGDMTMGGSERHLVQLLQRLDRRRFEPHLALQRIAGPLLAPVREAGVPIHELRVLGSGLQLLSASFRLRALAARLEPDILHSYGYPSDILCALARPATRARVITSRRGNQTLRRRRILYTLTNPFVDAILCVSKATAEFARRAESAPERKLFVIPNGIDVASYPRVAARSSGPAVIGCLGRLREVKGPDLLLQAFGRLADRGAELRFGGPVDDEWGRGLLATWSGAAHVRFDGEIADVKAFLRELDVFVLPSRSEGMSNTLLEAMASGLPIVATDVGSNRELLEGGRCGLIVPPDVEALADALAKILEDRDAARRMGEAARERVAAEFDLSAMVRRYESFYDRILDGRSGRAA